MGCVAEAFADDGISRKRGLDARSGLVGLIERAQATPGAIWSTASPVSREGLLLRLIDKANGCGGLERD